MKTKELISGFLFYGLSIGSLIALADDDDHDGSRESRRRERRQVAAPADPTYKSECGSCHMVYPPGLLPARSWQGIMTGLDHHFGENASLDKESSAKITKFLRENAADHSQLRRSQKIAQSIPQDQSPLRITETLYFKRQHHEVSAKVWARKSIGSSANCAACHRGAESGVFSEDEVRIPR